VAAARLSLAGAVLLVASLFFTWLELPLFGSQTGQPAGGTQAGEQSLDGWTLLESGDTILLFIALIAIGLVVFRSIEGPWLLILGVGAFSVVLPFMFSGVPMTEVYEDVYSDAGFSYDAAQGTGVWIAGAGTIVLLIAGVMQVSDRLPSRRGPRRTARVPTGRDAGDEDAPSERGGEPTWGWQSGRRRR
jgi:hypothetical protein